MEIPSPRTREQRILYFLYREFVFMRSRVAEIDKRLAEVEEKPQEIIEELRRLWNSDPEGGGDPHE